MPAEIPDSDRKDDATAPAAHGRDESPATTAARRPAVELLFPGATSAKEDRANRTQHQLIEEALRENEERLRLAVEAGKIGTCDWNYHAGKMRWNATRFRMYGLEPQNRIMDAEEFYAAVHPDDRARVQREITAGVEGPGEHSEEYRVVWPDGTVRWIAETGRVVEWKDQKPLRIISVLFDVTGRRESEAAVRKSEETLRLVLENAREYAIVSTDLEHRVTTWNVGAERLLGYREREILGQTAKVIHTPEDLASGRSEEESRRALDKGRAAHESWHVRKDGSRFWGSGVLTVMRDAQGVAVGFVKIFRDQTSELQAKEELERSRADLRAALQEAERARSAAEHARALAETAGQAKDHFLAVLSHELRTPLTPVLMAVHLLGRNQDLPKATRDALDMIQRNVQIEAHLIDDLLDLTKITRGKLEIVRQPLNLHQAVQHAVEITAGDVQSKAQRLTVELTATEHTLSGDPTRLQQVFWNLLKNASKFTPDGGSIHITSRDDSGRIIVEISDTGIGFEAEAVTRIFDAFAQADNVVMQKFGGLGLGLAISKATVDAHGGRLHARSEGQDQGATFTVELPLTVENGNEGSDHSYAPPEPFPTRDSGLYRPLDETQGR